MTELQNILKTTQPIPSKYREKSLEEIKKDLEDIKFDEVLNPHVFNLISLINNHFSYTPKVVTKIEDHGEIKTVDLEINDKYHSYWINGTPVHNTVNLPFEFPFNDFKDIYIDAFETGYIKGLTTYRAGTMASVLSVKEEQNVDIEEEIIVESVRLPDSNPATVKILRAERRKWYLTAVTHQETNKPIALFAHTNNMEKTVTTNDAVEQLTDLARKKGISECHIQDLEFKLKSEDNVSKICRTISLLLRHGVLIKNVVSAIDKMEFITVGSFLFAIKKFLSQYIKDGAKVENTKCHECGSNDVVYQEGCQICLSCGSSKCS